MTGTHKISVHDACRVNVLQTSEDLIQEVLNELLLERSTGKQSMQIGTEELGDKVTVVNKAQAD